MHPALTRRLRAAAACLTAVAAVLLGAASPASADSLTATITFPADGATGVNLTQPIQLTAVTGVQAYYLYVGTTVGAKDLVNTGEILQTSFMPANLPVGQTLYARMWTRAGNVWRYVDSTFSLAAIPTLTATLTFPANGAVNVNLSQPIQWTSIANVQAYYLYVGTSVGAKDLVNTGETLQTSYVAANLPIGQTLYVRMWTKVGGTWRYVDSTFSVGSIPVLGATLTYPANGATNADTSLAFQWTTVANVQAYYLYVGTTQGAKDLVNTGELQTTSYHGVSLPSGQTLYARMWTKVGGTWRYNDTTFTAAAIAPLTATITYPANGAVNADLTSPIQWTTVANAQAYYLYIGTTVGAKDLVNSGEIQATSYLAGGLPAGQMLYVRLWTKVAGAWQYVDSSFSAAPGPSLTATLTYPADGATGVDMTIPIAWTSVANAQAYYLYVGTTAGAKDVVNTGETLDTSYLAAGVPIRQVLYVRLFTKVAGVWRHVDSTFTAGALVSEFTYPLDGSIGIDGAQAFSWTTAVSAQAYKLQVGTTAGAADVADSGELAGTSYVVPGLSQSGPLYARVWVKVGGMWKYHNDIGFSLDGSVSPSTITIPANGETSFWTARPFQWADVPLARGYRLQIGTAFGGSDLHDSGEIHVTSRFVSGLPLGQTLYGRLQTKIDGQWSATDFTFTATSDTPSTTLTLKAAFDATDFVRQMAAEDLHPNGWTELYQYVWPRYVSVCGDFAPVLLQVLTEMNVPYPSRILNVAFDANHYDTHQLVELWNPDQNNWMLLDPTFDLTATNSDGSYATAADMAQATAAFNWTTISYQFFGAAGDQYARSYYLDYPLLFLNPTPDVAGQGPSPLPFLQSAPVPASGSYALYLVRCTAAASTSVIVDGTATTVTCDGVDALSKIFGASSIDTPVAPAEFELYQPKRFVF